MCFLDRTNTEVVANEGDGPVFLMVSRSNGLETAVSVEWVTESVTAVASGETRIQSLNLLNVTSVLLLFLLSSFSANKKCHHDSFFCLILPEGNLLVMGVYQSFEDNPTSAWCSLPEGPSFLAMRLDRSPTVGSSHTFATLYQWQGVFVSVEVG